MKQLFLCLLIIMTVSCTASATETPETGAKRFVDALMADDIVALLDATDETMPLRELEIRNVALTWESETTLVDGAYSSCSEKRFGLVQGYEIKTVDIKSAESATVAVLLKQEIGESVMPLDLRKNQGTWRVIDWDFKKECS